MNDTSTLLWGLVFGSIGIGYFIYGKKQKNIIAFWAGIGLIIYPYFVSSNLLLVGTGVALMALPFLLKNLL